MSEDIILTPGKLYLLNEDLCRLRGFKTNIAMCLTKPISTKWKIKYSVTDFAITYEYAEITKILVDSKTQDIFMSLPIQHYFIEKL